MFIFHLIFFLQNACLQCFDRNYFTSHSLSNRTKPQLTDSLIQQHLFIYSALIKEIFQESAVCVCIPGSVLPNHTAPGQNTVPVCEGSSSSGCVVSEVQPYFVNTHLPPATHFRLARQPFRFIPALCIDTYWFCTCTKTQKLWCWGEWEKRLCAVLCHLPVQHNLREMMPCSTQITIWRVTLLFWH